MMEGVHALAIQNVFVPLIKAVAEGEITCERARQRLSESPAAFTVHDAWLSLQGNSAKGYVTVTDVHSWLREQPHRLPRMLQDDVADVVFPFCNASGELHYEGFLRMVLPRDDSTLRELSISRINGQSIDVRSSHLMSTEASYRLARLLEEEIDIAVHLHQHRRVVVKQGLTPTDAFHFLSQGKPLGYSISLIELQYLLYDRLGELSIPQVAAFFRRACMFSSVSLTYEDVVHLLNPKHARDCLGYARDYLGYASSLSTTALNASRSLSPLTSPLRASSPRAISPRALLRSPLSPRLVGHSLPGDMGPVSPRSLLAPLLASELLGSPLPSLRAIHYPRAYMLDPPAPLLSPRSLSAYRRPLSPITMSPRTSSYARALERPLLTLGPHIQVALEFMERQGQLDHHLENTKALLPKNVPVEAVYGMLDADHKGYVTDRDIWHFAQRCGYNLPLGSMLALIMELQNSRSHDLGYIRGQLSLREVGVLIHTKGTLDHEALDSSTSDQEARSNLYVMRYTEACPGCGFRIQRDADAAGCPNVTCPICRKTFHCTTVMGDRDHNGIIRDISDTDHLFYTALSTDEQAIVCRIIEASAMAADEMEGLRKQLSLAHSPYFANVFNAISGGKNFFTFVDLRRALFEYKYWSSEHELQLIWHRYAHKADKVTFTAFQKQLEPLMVRS